MIVHMVDGRAKVVEQAPEPPTTRLRFGPLEFVRLGCGRESAERALSEGASLEGDVPLGRAILDAMNIMI